MTDDALRARLRAPAPVLLDGGLATTLEAHGHSLRDGLEERGLGEYAGSYLVQEMVDDGVEGRPIHRQLNDRQLVLTWLLRAVALVVIVVVVMVMMAIVFGASKSKPLQHTPDHHRYFVSSLSSFKAALASVAEPLRQCSM
jgi:hypothetical protein